MLNNQSSYEIAAAETEEAPQPTATRTLVRQEAAVKTAPARANAPVPSTPEPAPAAPVAPAPSAPEPSLFKGLVKSLVSLFAGKDEPVAAPVANTEKPAAERPQRNEERRNGRQQSRNRNGRRDEDRKPREERSERARAKSVSHVKSVPRVKNAPP